MTGVGPSEPPNRSAQKPTVCLSGLLEFMHFSPPSRFRWEWRGMSILGGNSVNESGRVMSPWWCLRIRTLSPRLRLRLMWTKAKKDLTNDFRLDLSHCPDLADRLLPLNRKNVNFERSRADFVQKWHRLLCAGLVRPMRYQLRRRGSASKSPDGSVAELLCGP